MIPTSLAASSIGSCDMVDAQRQQALRSVSLAGFHRALMYISGATSWLIALDHTQNACLQILQLEPFCAWR